MMQNISTYFPLSAFQVGDEMAKKLSEAPEEYRKRF